MSSRRQDPRFPNLCNFIDKDETLCGKRSAYGRCPVHKVRNSYRRCFSCDVMTNNLLGTCSDCENLNKKHYVESFREAYGVVIDERLYRIHRLKKYLEYECDQSEVERICGGIHDSDEDDE